MKKIKAPIIYTYWTLKFIKFADGNGNISLENIKHILRFYKVPKSFDFKILQEMLDMNLISKENKRLFKLKYVPFQKDIISITKSDNITYTEKIKLFNEVISICN